MVTVTTTNLLQQYGEQLVLEELERLQAERSRLPHWRRMLLAVRDLANVVVHPARPVAAARTVLGAGASLAAAGCTVAGVHELAGTGWALLSAVPFLLLLERRLT